MPVRTIRGAGDVCQVSPRVGAPHAARGGCPVQTEALARLGSEARAGSRHAHYTFLCKRK